MKFFCEEKSKRCKKNYAGQGGGQGRGGGQGQRLTTTTPTKDGPHHT